MNIALLNPPWPHPSDPMQWGVRAGSRWPHFQPRAAPGQLPRYVPFPFFLSIAAQVLARAGHTVLLLDGVAENLPPDAFLKRVQTFDPDLIFLETSTPSLRHDREVMAALRRLCPKARLAAGGTHPAALATGMLGQPAGPDYWLAGEYELPLASLAAALAAQRTASGLPGVATTDRPIGAPATPPDVDELPPPLFAQLPIAGYSDPVCGLPSPSAQSWLSRGCPFGCSFCVWPQVIYGNRRHRPRRLSLALDEVQWLIDQGHCESFYFDDDTANLGEARMIELGAEIRRRGLNSYPWAMMARADCMTPRMLEALSDAGMYSVKYGVESCSPALLNACDKATNWERLEAGLRHTRKLGIKIHLTFTLGVPGETPESIRRTVQFALEVAPDTAQFSICTPFPGTRFHEECRRNGWLVTEDWERFLGTGEAVVQTPWLSAAQLTEGYHEALQAWRQAQTNRLSHLQDALVTRLRRAVGAGHRWRLLGDADFAAFLGQQAPDLLAARVPDTPQEHSRVDTSVTAVIVSRHDEEKIRRQLRRSHAVPATGMLGLYSS